MYSLPFISPAYSPSVVDGRDVGSLDVFIPIFISYGNAHNALPSEERQRCGNPDSRREMRLISVAEDARSANRLVHRTCTRLLSTRLGYPFLVVLVVLLLSVLGKVEETP